VQAVTPPQAALEVSRMELIDTVAQSDLRSFAHSLLSACSTRCCCHHHGHKHTDGHQSAKTIPNGDVAEGLNLPISGRFGLLSVFEVVLQSSYPRTDQDMTS
jgi:hypothetical protein